MPRPDEGLIHAWLDGECTPDEAARIERLVATDPEWSAAVAEARGLIAASSRIVSALDSVPTAMPAGSQAAPQSTPRRGLRVPAWMGMAAALVLVAGTAYVLRERATDPFTASVATEPVVPPLAEFSDSTPRSAQDSTSQPLSPPVESRPAAEASGRRPMTTAAAGAGASTAPPAPTAATEPPAERTAAAEKSGVDQEQSARRASELERAAAQAASAEQELRRSRSALRQAAAPAAAPLAAPLADAAVALLEGCWRVTAPPQAVGVLRFPRLLEQRGDSLRLVTLQDTLWVTRAADRLHGSLEAARVDCPPDP